MGAGKRNIKLPMLVLAILVLLTIIAIAKIWTPSEINGGDDDIHVAVEVQALSDIHNGQFEALMSDGRHVKVDERRYIYSYGSVRAGEKWTLCFSKNVDLEDGILCPYYAERSTE